MSPGTFDPYELMPFTGYIDPASGRQVRYQSLAHFIHSERLRGVDEHYRAYLLKLEDAELLRLEVDGIGYLGNDSSGWQERKSRIIYAGIFMQAVANRERYSQLMNQTGLSVASGSYSNDLAEALGQFINDVSSPNDKLKVAFAGGCDDQAYIESCLNIVFARRLPQCLFAIEDDPCSFAISEYARESSTAFTLLDSSLSDEAIVENLQRRTTHVFRFLGSSNAHLSDRVLALAAEAGTTVTPIQPKP